MANEKAACICLEYGHGMLLTRVHNYGCPVHGDKTTTPELQKAPTAELEARVEEWVRNG